jgi:hypothetical protein
VRTESMALTLPRCCRGTQSISTAARQAVCSAGVAWVGENEAGACLRPAAIQLPPRPPLAPRHTPERIKGRVALATAMRTKCTATNSAAQKWAQWAGRHADKQAYVQRSCEEAAE